MLPIDRPRNELFVCGSLAEGMVHFSRIAQLVGERRPAMLHGSMYRLEVGYPVYCQNGQHQVRGQLVTISTTDLLLQLLDEFHAYSAQAPEKSIFQRLDVEALLDDGTLVPAFAYSVNPEKLPSTARLIENGDWQMDLQQNPPMTLGLTDRQKQYIRKLGASSGRDIVPINLDLYRELMGKGLIVDKGRRLALTRLGQEVFRYLD